MKNSKFKTNDIVKVISGTFFGRVEKVIKIDRSRNFAYLEGIFREKFIKKNNQNENNDSDENENSSPEINSKKKKILIPINISNLKKHSVENEK